MLAQANKLKEVSETDFQVSTDKYAAALATFEKSVSGLKDTDDYRKAQAEIDARKTAR